MKTLIPNRRKRKVVIQRGNREVTMFARPGALLPRTYDPFYANDTSAYKPELWANEGVAILNEEMVLAGTVKRSFEDEIQRFGDTVHTRRPAALKGKRKQNDLDDVVDQDVSATDIEVKLNQRLYVSFVLGDRERSMSFKNLTEEFLYEAMVGQARLIDRIVGAQAYQFLANTAGGLGQLSTSNAHQYLIDMREVFNRNKVPFNPRWLGLGVNSESKIQKNDLFVSAERRGDGGRALRDAYLSRLAGWNLFLEQNVPSVQTGAGTKTATTTTTATAAVGDLVINATAVTNLNPGQYYTVAGDYTPLRVASVNTLAVTNTRALKGAVASGAVIQPYALGAIKQSSAGGAGDISASYASGYPQHWQLGIRVDGTGVPHAGQLVAFRTAGGAVHSAEYGIVDVTDIGGGEYEIMLDRPLEQAVLDNDIVCYGPDGDYNMAYQSDAIALVNRPLALPPSDAGVRAGYGFDNNISMRAMIGYDIKKQAQRVVIDCLLGVKVLDSARGGVLLG